MSNFKSNKRISLASFIAVILIVLMVVGAVFGCGYHFGWFSKMDEETSEEASGGGAVISDGESNGIMLTSAKLLGAGNSTAESTYQLTATVTPSYATISTLSWGIAWDTSYSGYSSSGSCTDANGDSWITGISSANISDYVSLSSTTGTSVTVSCWKPFGNPLIITATSTDGTNISATCKVDYQAHYTSVDVTDLSSVSMSSSSTSRQAVDISVAYTTGTIVVSGTITYSVSPNDSEMAEYLDPSGYYTYTIFTDADAWYLATHPSASNQSISGMYSKRILEFSTNWTTFVQEWIDGNTYWDGNDSGYSYSDYGTDALVEYYNMINYFGLSNFHPFTITVSLTDSKTGSVLTDSTAMTFASVSDFPISLVTGVTMANSITF